MSLLLDVFAPTKCLFCNRLGSRVCSVCESSVGSSPRLVYRDGRIGFSATDYNDDAKKLLRSFKELGESELASTMARAILPLLGCFEELPSLLVPIPSNRSSLRARGFNPAELLAREVSLRRPGLTWANLFVRTRETLDQSKLSPTERHENQAGSLVARVGQGSVLIVDDVITTGATITQAAKDLEKAGYFVQGFITFAETESKRCNLTTQATLPADGGTSWN
jgi:ComF family protein